MLWELVFHMWHQDKNSVVFHFNFLKQALKPKPRKLWSVLGALCCTSLLVSPLLGVVGLLCEGEFACDS